MQSVPALVACCHPRIKWQPGRRSSSVPYKGAIHAGFTHERSLQELSLPRAIFANSNKAECNGLLGPSPISCSVGSVKGLFYSLQSSKSIGKVYKRRNMKLADTQKYKF